MFNKLTILIVLICTLASIDTVVEAKNPNIPPLNGVTPLSKVKYKGKTFSMLYFSIGTNQVYCKTSRMLVNFPPTSVEYTLVLGRELWFDPIAIMSQAIDQFKGVLVKSDIVCVPASNLSVINRWSARYSFVGEFPTRPVYYGDFIYYIHLYDSMLNSVWDNGISVWCRGKSVGNAVTNKTYSYAIFTVSDIVSNSLNYSSPDFNCTSDNLVVKTWIRQKYKFYRYS